MARVPAGTGAGTQTTPLPAHPAHQDDAGPGRSLPEDDLGGPAQNGQARHPAASRATSSREAPEGKRVPVMPGSLRWMVHASSCHTEPAVPS